MDYCICQFWEKYKSSGQPGGHPAIRCIFPGLPTGGGNWGNLPRAPCMRGGPQPKMGLRYLVLQQFFPSPLFRCIIPSHNLATCLQSREPIAYSLAITPTIGASLFGFALGFQNPLSSPAYSISAWRLSK